MPNGTEYTLTVSRGETSIDLKSQRLEFTYQDESHFRVATYSGSVGGEIREMQPDGIIQKLKMFIDLIKRPGQYIFSEKRSFTNDRPDEAENDIKFLTEAAHLLARASRRK